MSDSITIPDTISSWQTHLDGETALYSKRESILFSSASSASERYGIRKALQGELALIENVCESLKKFELDLQTCEVPKLRAALESSIAEYAHNSLVISNRHESDSDFEKAIADFLPMIELLNTSITTVSNSIVEGAGILKGLYEKRNRPNIDIDYDIIPAHLASILEDGNEMLSHSHGFFIKLSEVEVTVAEMHQKMIDQVLLPMLDEMKSGNAAKIARRYNVLIQISLHGPVAASVGLNMLGQNILAAILAASGPTLGGRIKSFFVDKRESRIEWDQRKTVRSLKYSIPVFAIMFGNLALISGKQHLSISKFPA